MAIKNCKNGCDLKGSRSHAKGGIKGVVEGSQKQIEVESNEVIVRASVLNDPKKYIYTGTHKQIVEQINGGFNTVVNDNDDCILVEAGQVVINKKTLDDDKIRTYTGTNKEVLNKINKHLNSGVSIYKNGGIIPIGNNKIKTIFFKKEKFTKPQAVAWAKNHGFDYAQSYDENKSNYIFRCNDKNAFKKHTYRTIELKESGIKIIIGVEKMEQGGTITQNTILEKRKQFMSDFMDWYKKDVHEKMNIYITINSEMVTIDLFEKIDQEIDAKPYLKYVCDLADKYNIDLFLEPVPRYKFFLKNTEKRKKISKEYLIEYYKKFGFKEIEEGMIRESKMSNFVRTFYSDIQSKYTIEIDKTHDKFEMFGVKGHFEFLIPSDKTEGEILMYFEVQQYRAMADFLNTKGDVIVTPVIKCYIDKNYNITFDYSELDKYLIQNDIEKFDKGGEIVNDKYYILSFGNYIQVKFIEKINIQGIDLFLYNDDGYFGVADEKTGIRIGGSAKEKDRAIDNANDFIEHHGEEKVIEHLKNAQLSPRYSKETKTFEESQFEKIKELYESKNFEKLYEIISNNANTTSRKALSQILERSIVNYNNSQILDLFLEFGYDVRKINLENERLKKQKEAELKQAEIDKQNEYKKTEYPYLDLSNMSAKQFGVLDKAMQKKYRYPDGVKTVSEHIKSLKDEIVETKEFIDEFTKSGDRRSEPLHEYYVKLQSGSLWSIPKLAYDNWVGFKKDTEILQGGVSDGKHITDIAEKHGVDETYVYEQITKGIEIEKEHTENEIIAEEIAKDHLWESIFYYEELEKMEEKIKNIKSSKNYADSELLELCKQADINKETLVFDVPDDRVEFFKSLGFVVKE